MSEINRFSSHIEAGFGEKKVSQRVIQKEIHIPHHALNPFQKFITVVELIFTGWLIYLVIKVIINNIVHISHAI